MTGTLAYGYSSESTQLELSNEYQHDRVQMVIKGICILVLWIKEASALEGFLHHLVLANLATCSVRFKVLEGLTLMLLVANLAYTK